jgi:hypothetical protein
MKVSMNCANALRLIVALLFLGRNFGLKQESELEANFQLTSRESGQDDDGQDADETEFESKLCLSGFLNTYFGFGS